MEMCNVLLLCWSYFNHSCLHIQIQCLSKDKSGEKKEVRVSNVSEHIAETATGEPYTLDEKNKPVPAVAGDESELIEKPTQ